MGKKSKSGGGNRKHGRAKKKCAAYRLEGREDINRVRKMERHVRRNPDDVRAASLLKKL